MSNIFLANRTFGEKIKKILPNLFSKNNKFKKMEDVKKMVWSTNFNNKMVCNAFLHIDFPPKQHLENRHWENKEFEIETEDKSYRNIRVRLIDIITLEIHQKRIPETFTLASHGMNYQEFVDYLFKKFPKRMGNTPELSVYYYKKIS